jgi:predicted amino acid-binding ACT domain protein
MALNIDISRLTKLLLLFCGAALLVAGFFGLMIDFLEDWNIKPENSSSFVIILGVAILLITSIVFYFLPTYQEKHRLQLLKQHYLNRPRGEIMNIKHNILDTSQIIIANIEMLTMLCDECSKDETFKADCKNKLENANTNLEQASKEINKLKGLIKELEDRIKI